MERLTGYPRDLLDLDLDLEADLGVDTVKQAEVFAAVRERFAIPRQDNHRLRDIPTLAQVIGFVRDHAVPTQAVPAESAGSGAAPGGSANQPAAPESQTAPVTALQAEPAFTGDMAAAERLPRRVPVRVLRPPAESCKPTAVTLDTGRVIVMADEGGVAKTLVRRLDSLGASALVIEPGCPADDLDSRLTDWLAEGPVHGIYWLAALDAVPALSELDLTSWHEALRRRVKNLYAVVRRSTGPASSGRTAGSWSQAPGWAATTAMTTAERRRRSAAR